MKLYRFKAKKGKGGLLGKTTVIVGAIMVGLFMAFGSVIVTQQIFMQETEFDSAPVPQEKIDNSQQKVNILKKTVAKPTGAVKRIVVKAPAQVASSEVQISIPKAFGDGFGTGVEMGTFDPTQLAASKMELNLPEVKLFDVAGKSDRILIVFDVCERTMTDEMGGLDAYNVVKDEIVRLVNGLPATILFNVMAVDNYGFHDRNKVAKLFRSSLVSANASNKAALASWMKPINPTPREIGLGTVPTEEAYELRFSPPPYNEKYQFPNDVHQNLWVVGRMRTYQAAIEQGAGVIFFLTTTWVRPEEYWYKISDAELAAYKKTQDKEREDWVKKGNKLITQEAKEALYAQARVEGWKILEEENKKRAAAGKPLRVERDSLGVAREHKVAAAVQADTSKAPNDFRPFIKYKEYSQNNLLAVYEPIFKKIYDDKKLPRPILNLIIMLPKKSGDRDAKDGKNQYGNTYVGGNGLSKDQQTAAGRWTKAHGDGKVRILRGAKPVSDF